MDVETILIAKKFSGAADVSAAKNYRDAAQAAAARAENAVANLPESYTSLLTDVADMKTDIGELESSVNSLESAIATGGASISITGDVGDPVRLGENNSLYAGKKPIQKLLDIEVPDDVETDTSDVTWLTDTNGNVTGFVITEDQNGKTIDSYNHDHFILTVSNIINYVTVQKQTASTVIYDIDYVNGLQTDKDKRSEYMYYQIPYDKARQINVDIGVNAAGCAYTHLEYGTSNKSGQIFPGATVTDMGNRYQKFLTSDHVKAISYILLTGYFTPKTVIRVWKG